MAVNDKRLRVTELDFDDIKDNLKIFLKAQNQFTDYDFEGSGMSVLLDTLAYNTHYMAYNANMVANEMFLDSASLRSSVVSHAKKLGYEVSSCRAPKATVNISLTTGLSSRTMPAGTTFTTTVNGTNYNFVTISDITSNNSGTSVNFDGTSIYEGTWITSKYLVDSSDEEQRFIIDDARADTTTLIVKVQTSASDTFTRTYTKATDISELTDASTVYFLQEVETGKFEVYFGDGVLSQAVSDGNIVSLQYVVTNKSEANGARVFSSPSAINGITDITVTTVGIATGGAEPESIASVKLNAPLDYAAQGRAVTTNDYKTFVRKLFANAQAVSVWGGEDGSYDTSTGVSSTPEYGKVFISIKSTTGNSLTDVQKSNLVAGLSPYKVGSITPVIVDAETTFIILNTTVQYDSSATTYSATELATRVTNVISSYNTSDLQTFNAPFRHSKLLGLIDNTDSSILNNTTTVIMAKYIVPTLNTSTSYILNFNNAFYYPHEGHNKDSGGIISSTGFSMSSIDSTKEYFLDDDGSGNLRIYSLVAGTRVYSNLNAGAVDYTNGKITLNPIMISAVSNVDGAVSTQIRVTVIPNSYDIIPVRNQILELDTLNSTVVAGVDATASTGIGYTTTTTGGTTTTTVTSTSSTSSPSAY